METLQNGDPNMLMALAIANNLGTFHSLPTSLQSLTLRAEFVDRIDGPLVMSANNLIDIAGQIAKQLRKIEEVSRHYLLDVSDAMLRISIGLRLWSGCLTAAKTIALSTRSGPNTPMMRTQMMAEIEIIASRDGIYAAGVESAPEFKRLRQEEYSLDGVPDDSIVRERTRSKQ